MKNNGGPAFPYGFVTDHATVKTQEGMSLRDWFAGMALQGFLNSSIPVAIRAIYAYEMADAMLAEREKPLDNKLP